MAHEVITHQPEVDHVVDRLRGIDRYALDTEFHRERTYYPQLALVQIASDHETFLIDPLAVDVAPLRRLFESDALAVMHAAGQDVEVLDHAVGAAPEHIYDTQVAAGFIGLSSPSLATLLKNQLGVDLPKAARLSDWLKRPLGDAQLHYAAADVDHLLELHNRLRDAVESRGRTAWARAENELVISKYRQRRRPDDAWAKVKEIRQLRGKALAAAEEIAKWRDERAAHLDIPVRHVMSDIGLVGLAQRRPRSADKVEGIRGFDPRQLRRRDLDALLDRIARAADGQPRPAPTPTSTKLPPDIRPLVPLVRAWVGQVARELDLDPILLATRADIETRLAGEPSRLDDGWREQALGGAVDALVEGRAALAYEAGAGLRLVRDP